jgi:hypothetical protein
MAGGSPPEGSPPESSRPESSPRWIRIKPYVEAVVAVVGILSIGFLGWQVIDLDSQTKSLDSQTQSLKEQVEQAYRNDTFSKSLELDKLILDKPVEYRTVVAPGKGPELIKKGQKTPMSWQRKKPSQCISLISLTIY